MTRHLPSRIARGAAMDAIRNEIVRGVPTHGRMHMTKGKEALSGLKDWLRRNPTLLTTTDMSLVLQGAR